MSLWTVCPKHLPDLLYETLLPATCMGVFCLSDRDWLTGFITEHEDWSFLSSSLLADGPTFHIEALISSHQLVTGLTLCPFLFQGTFLSHPDPGSLSSPLGRLCLSVTRFWMLPTAHLPPEPAMGFSLRASEPLPVLRAGILL